MLKSHCSAPCVLALQECWTTDLADVIGAAFPTHNMYYRTAKGMTWSAYALLFGVYGIVLGTFSIRCTLSPYFGTGITLPLTLVFLSTWVAFIISGSVWMVFHAWARSTASYAFITGTVAGGLVTLYPQMSTDTKLTTHTAIKLPSPQSQYFWLEKLKDRYALFVQPPASSPLPSTLNVHMCLTNLDLECVVLLYLSVFHIFDLRLCSPSQQWLAQMAFIRRIIAGQITNVDTPNVILGDFNHDRYVYVYKSMNLNLISDRITLSYDYNDDHPAEQTTFDKTNPLTSSSSYPGADPIDELSAVRLVCFCYIIHSRSHGIQDHIFVHKTCPFSNSVLVKIDNNPSDHFGLIRQSEITQ